MSTEMKETRSNRAGTSWIEMCGQVVQLSVGPNDQVGIDGDLRPS